MEPTTQLGIKKVLGWELRVGEFGGDQRSSVFEHRMTWMWSKHFQYALQTNALLIQSFESLKI